ncbi:MAG: glycosyltransferase family 4 protein [Bacteroidia bacterium]|nr:glycosyltransferase family 4 protein [Bacteroidia bacterium]
MKILYFHQYFGTPTGKSGIRSYEMAKNLISRGHSVTVVFASSERRESPINHIPFKRKIRRGNFEGIGLIELNVKMDSNYGIIKRAIIFLRFVFLSLKLVFIERYDLLFATSTPLTIAIPGIIMKWFYPKRKFVFEVRDLWPELPREMGVIKNKFVLWLMGYLEYSAYANANGFIALSPGIKEGIYKTMPDKSKKIVLVPNGSDLNLFYPSEVEKEIIPGVHSDDFVAIFTGAHGAANGLDAALDAAKILLEKDEKSIKLVFVGTGNQKNRLINRKEKEGLTNCIFNEPVSKLKLVKYLQAADVGLMLLANVPAFYYGTSPNKFFDFISSGLPVLNNYPGWLAGLITENNAGIAIQPEDSQAFADALIKLKSMDKLELKKLGVNARSLAEREFNREKLGETFSKALESI